MGVVKSAKRHTLVFTSPGEPSIDAAWRFCRQHGDATAEGKCRDVACNVSNEKPRNRQCSRPASNENRLSRINFPHRRYNARPLRGMDIITKPYGVHHEQTHIASRFTAQREIPPAHRQGQKRQRRFQPPREAQKTPPGSRWCFFMSVIPALLGINDGSACPTRCRYWQPAHR